MNSNITSLMLLSITISLIFLIFLLQHQQKADAKIIHNNIANTDIDTSKPLPPQINAMVLSSRQVNSSSINGINTIFQGMVSSCNNPGGLAMAEGMTHKPLQSMCNSGIALIYEFCQAEEFRKGASICSDPEINDYLRSHNISDVQAYAVYGLEQFAANNNSTTTANQASLNKRINNVVDFCLKSLPGGTSACDSQLGPVLNRICSGENTQQPFDACHDGKVAQYYKVRNNEIAKVNKSSNNSTK